MRAPLVLPALHVALLGFTLAPLSILAFQVPVLRVHSTLSSFKSNNQWMNRNPIMSSRTTTTTTSTALYPNPNPNPIMQSSSSSSSSPLKRQHWKLQSKLKMSNVETTTEQQQQQPDDDELIVETSKTLHRISWLSWWSQVILTVVSSITLIFARNVIRAVGSPSSISSSSNKAAMGGEGLLIAGTGLVVSFLSIIWTWGGARLGKRLLKKNTRRIEAAHMVRRAISVGVTLNLVGMALALVGAEQIVGSLAVKVLTQQGGVFGGVDRVAVQTLQPLDILVVQGNTNTLLSHFCSLVSLLYQTKLVRQLDPPSVEGDERKRLAS